MKTPVMHLLPSYEYPSIWGNLLKIGLRRLVSWSLIIALSPVFLEAFPLAPGRDSSTAPAGSHEPEQLTVAVLDMEGRGISQLEAETMTDHMRAALKGTGLVATIDPGRITEILDEMGSASMTHKSTALAVEVGRALGASQVLTGSLGKLGESYVIDLRLLAVDTGAIIRSYTRVYRGDADGLAMEVEKLAWDIVNVTRPGQPLAVSVSLLPEENQAVRRRGFPAGNVLPSNSMTAYSESGRNSEQASVKGAQLMHQIRWWVQANPEMVSAGLFPLAATILFGTIAHSRDDVKDGGIGNPPDFPEVPRR